MVRSLAQFGQESASLDFLSILARSSKIPAMYDPSNNPMHDTPKKMKIEQIILLASLVGTLSPRPKEQAS
jgi:hypothetical protein